MDPQNTMDPWNTVDPQNTMDPQNKRYQHHRTRNFMKQKSVMRWKSGNTGYNSKQTVQEVYTQTKISELTIYQKIYSQKYIQMKLNISQSFLKNSNKQDQQQEQQEQTTKLYFLNKTSKILLIVNVLIETCKK